jgi:hypothetical protein
MGIWGPEGMVLPPLDPVLGSVALVIVFGTQFPKLQRPFVAEQSVHALPPCPHALSSVPPLQTPLLQQPVPHVVELQGKETSSPLATVASSPLPLPPPLELLPPTLPELPPLLPLPAPPASGGGANKPPASCRRRLSGSPPVTFPVAHATAMNPPPSNSAPSAAQRYPQIIPRLLPTHAGATRASLTSERFPVMEIAWAQQNAMRTNANGATEPQN